MVHVRARSSCESWPSKELPNEPTMMPLRLIKRYGNRKLYDTSQSRYITLDEIARLVRSGNDVKVIDNETATISPPLPSPRSFSKKRSVDRA